MRSVLGAALLSCLSLGSTAQAVDEPRVFTAVSPLTRSQVAGEPRTAIMALINNGEVAATNCRISAAIQNTVWRYSFFEVSIDDNAITNTGAVNAPFDVPAGQTRYVALSHELFPSTFHSREEDAGVLRIGGQNLICDNTTVKSFAGLNELNLVPLAGTPADVVSAIVTPSLDGVLRVT
ncbi:MAG: hypothetical protein LAT81_13030, partial [Oceanicaulis sp.]|nr:hypothetical protein [Oceanicaulis sp.]